MTHSPITPGVVFRHPTQGVCTVTSVTRKAVRYTAEPVPGFDPRYFTTTPSALAACLAAGVLTEEASDADRAG